LILKGENPMMVDDIVHVDTDNLEWGRIASDGIILSIDSLASEALINVLDIRANIWIPIKDITEK
jgi:hypothetical protein